MLKHECNRCVRGIYARGVCVAQERRGRRRTAGIECFSHAPRVRVAGTAFTTRSGCCLLARQSAGISNIAPLIYAKAARPRFALDTRASVCVA